MLKRIGVQQLSVGMYLAEFCCSWMEHPFWRSGFVCTDPRDIERIQTSNIAEVWIDSERGVDVPAGARTTSTEEAESQIEATLGEIGQASPTEESVPATAEYVQAAKLCAEAKQTAIDLFGQARMGLSLDTARVEALVDAILHSITRNSCALASLVRLKRASDFTYLHGIAVCVLMIVLGRRLGLDREQLRLAGTAGFLHDIGKSVIPPEVLHKPGKLDDDELAVLRQHPQEGQRLLQNSGLDPAVLDVCLNHHSRADGNGYPNPFHINEISHFSRMAAVCDVYDAVSSGRPYKSAWDPADSIRKMTEWAPTHFDPVVFHAFVKSIGIYPIGALVRLVSGRLGVVVGQSANSLLTPNVKVFFSIPANARIVPEIVVLSSPACQDAIEAPEDPGKWHFPDLMTLWSGLADPQG